MFKLLLLLIGVGAGAAGATSWLLSEPQPPGTATTAEGEPVRVDVRTGASPTFSSISDELRVRLDDLKARFAEATAEGEQARRETEDRLRRELDADRKGSSAPSA